MWDLAAALITEAYTSPQERAARKAEEARRAALGPFARALEDFIAWTKLVRARLVMAADVLRGRRDWDLE